jgi:acetone carboxylase gamma subunit
MVNSSAASEPSNKGSIAHSIGAAFVVRESGDSREICCARCDHAFGPSSTDPKLAAVVAERPIVESCELNRYGAVDDLVLREYFCPDCGAMIAVNVQRPTDPILLEIELG